MILNQITSTFSVKELTNLTTSFNSLISDMLVNHLSQQTKRRLSSFQKNLLDFSLLKSIYLSLKSRAIFQQLIPKKSTYLHLAYRSFKFSLVGSFHSKMIPMTYNLKDFLKANWQSISYCNLSLLISRKSHPTTISSICFRTCSILTLKLASTLKQFFPILGSKTSSQSITSQQKTQQKLKNC